MKKLTSKVKVLEAKALRKLHKRSAADHARQAAKFREDSMKLGAQLSVAGEHIYKADHPVYDELILPLLHQASQIASKYGFNTLFQTQTPLPDMPHFTHMIGSASSETISPTMQGQLEYIQSRPIAKINKDGTPMITTAEKPFANDTAVECMAKAIYAQWEGQPGFEKWVDRGNSMNQDKARQIARLALREQPAEKSDTDAT